MVDNNSMFLYYIISGRIYKKEDSRKGGISNAYKNKGLRLLTKYWVKY